MEENILEQVRGSLPALDKLKEKAQGNPDMELVIERVEHIELLLEGTAELAVAQSDAERNAAESKVALNREKLKGPLG